MKNAQAEDDQRDVGIRGKQIHVAPHMPVAPDAVITQRSSGMPPSPLKGQI